MDAPNTAATTEYPHGAAPHAAATGEEEQHFSLKKVREKVKKIKDTISKKMHGHGNGNDNDDHKYEEEDREEVVDADPEVHAAPTYETSTARIPGREQEREQVAEPANLKNIKEKTIEEQPAAPKPGGDQKPTSPYGGDEILSSSLEGMTLSDQPERKEEGFEVKTVPTDKEIYSTPVYETTSSRIPGWEQEKEQVTEPANLKNIKEKTIEEDSAAPKPGGGDEMLSSLEGMTLSDQPERKEEGFEGKTVPTDKEVYSTPVYETTSSRIPGREQEKEQVTEPANLKNIKEKTIEEQPAAPKPGGDQKPTSPYGGDEILSSSLEGMILSDQPERKEEGVEGKTIPTDKEVYSTPVYETTSSRIPGREQEKEQVTEPANLKNIKEKTIEEQPAAPKPGGGDEMLSSAEGMNLSDQPEREEEGRTALTGESTDRVVEKNPGYTEKITSTAVAAKDVAVSAATAVYGMMTGAGTTVMGKENQKGGGSSGGEEHQQQQDKGVKGYLAEKLKPGEEDRALSEVLTEAVQGKKKEGKDVVEINH